MQDETRTPAQWFGLIVGALMVAAGVLALIAGSTNFGSVSGGAGENFVIWRVSGWETVLYVVFGLLGILSAARAASARSFALTLGLLFAVIAVWGFADGESVASVFAVDTTDNITYAVLGAAGLLIGLMPDPMQGARDVPPHHTGGGHPTRA